MDEPRIDTVQLDFFGSRTNGDAPKILNASKMRAISMATGFARSKLSVKTGEDELTLLVHALRPAPLLETIAAIEITDDLEAAGYATVFKYLTDEQVLRAWAELLRLRTIVLPLVSDLHRAARLLRQEAVRPGMYDGNFPARMFDLAGELDRHALRLDGEYQWFEGKICPGVEKILEQAG